VSFSKQQIDELCDCLGRADAEAIIPALEEIIADSPRQRAAFEEDYRGEREERVRRLRSFLTTLRSTQRASDALGPAEPSAAATDLDHDLDLARWREDLNRREQQATARVARLGKVLDYHAASSSQRLQ